MMLQGYVTDTYQKRHKLYNLLSNIEQDHPCNLQVAVIMRILRLLQKI